MKRCEQISDFVCTFKKKNYNLRNKKIDKMIINEINGAENKLENG